MQIEQFICRSDNFGVLIHDEASGLTASIDAPDADAILKTLHKRGWTLNTVLITHHHLDHVEGIEKLKQQTSAQIIGPDSEKNKISGLDQTVIPTETLTFGQETIEVLASGGHTLGEVSYYLPKAGLVFTGDTLFSLGCGRLFEGTPQMMLESLKTLRDLPDSTQIYCGHEYTLSNARFALTIDPDNTLLIKRAEDVKAMRASDIATLPSTIALEKATNPFLRWDEPKIRQNLGLETASDLEIFTEIRTRKDQF